MMKDFRHGNISFRHPESWTDQSRLVLMAEGNSNLLFSKQSLEGNSLPDHMAVCSEQVEKDLSSVEAKLVTSEAWEGSIYSGWKSTFEFIPQPDGEVWVQVHVAFQDRDDVFMFVWTSSATAYSDGQHILNQVVNSLKIESR